MDRRMMGGTLLLLTLLGLHVYTLYALEQVRDSANYAQESVDDLEGRVAELAEEVESIRASVSANMAANAVGSVIADRNLDDLADLQLDVEEAKLEARAAKARAEVVANALCVASNYSECP